MSQVDVEEGIDVDIWIEVSRTIAYKDLINAVMNTDAEIKLENRPSDEEIIKAKNFGAKATNAYSTLLKFVESQSCYSAQEVTQLRVLLSTFLQK